MRKLLPALLSLAIAAGCGTPPSSEIDAGTTLPGADAGTTTSGADAGSTEPEADAGTTEPEADAGTTEPEADAGTTEPEADAGTAEPEADAGTTEPEADAGTTSPDAGVTIADCGNRVVEPGEECDDGNDSNLDACTNDCLDATCGDGFVEAGVEECDDTNQSDSDDCLTTCELATCGDGHVFLGTEACDPGGAPGLCDSDCTPVVCGDGLANEAAGEECDDENDVISDGCNLFCEARPNARPVADAAAASTFGGSPVAITLAGRDPDGDPVTFRIVSRPKNGTLSGAAPDLVYTADAGFVGSDSFTFVTDDGFADSASATVRVSVFSTASLPQVAVGAYHACAIDSAGAVRCWGHNSHGQLGLPNSGNPSVGNWGDSPGQTAFNAPVVNLADADGTPHRARYISTGAWQSCAILEDGSVKCWGNGMPGGAVTRVDFGAGATALASGDEFVCALLSDKSVKCIGDNRFGQLGTGDTNASWTPTVPVTFDANGSAGDVVRARALVAGAWFVCALLESGDVACWGHDYGYLGTETNNFGAFRPSALVDFGAGRKAVALGGSGMNHTCAILDDASLKCWGANGSGQLGLGNREFRGRAPGEMGSNLPAVDLGPGRRAVQVVGGGDHSCALLDDNSVKCWGSNMQDVPFQGWVLTGQLGLDGDPIPTGTLAPTDPVALGAGRTVLGIAARNGNSCAMLDGDEVKCWGSNRYGQLGLGDNAYRGDAPGEMSTLEACYDLTPPPVATSRKIVVRAGETTTFDVPITDADNQAQLTYTVMTPSGFAGTLSGSGPRLSYTPPEGFAGVDTLAIRATDPQGQSATAVLQISVFTGASLPTVAVGAYHTCAIDSAGSVRCWGHNNYGQLGVPNSGNPSVWNWGDSPGQTAFNAPVVNLADADGTPHRARFISAGAWQSCAILEDGSVKCWGNGMPGGAVTRVDFGAGATALASGDEFVCALLSDKSVKCIGDNRFGQLGTGDTNASWTPTVPVTFDANGSAGGVVRARALVAGAWFVCALLESGDVACWGHDFGYLGTETNNLGAFRPSAPVNFGGGLKALALGGSGMNHTCAILDDGSLKCWGANGSGQLGLGDRNFHGRARGEMGSNLPAVDLGPGRRAVQVVGGGDHSCALLDDNSVKCWGSNMQDVPFQGWVLTGQLGLDGDPIPTGTLAPTDPVALGAGRTVLGIAARNGNSCALLDGDEVKCWGSNRYGQLGLGDNAYRGDVPGEMSALEACYDLTPPPVATSRKILVRDGETTTFDVPITDADNQAQLTYTVMTPSGLAGSLSGSGRQLSYTPPRGFTGEDTVMIVATDPQGQSAMASLQISVFTGASLPTVSVGAYHACAIDSAGAVRCWGHNHYGQLGRPPGGDPAMWTWGDSPGQTAANAPVVNLADADATPHTARFVSVGAWQSCAILEDGSVKCWGNGMPGGAVTRVEFGAGATALASGDEFTCALLSDKSIKCIGDNRFGQLGTGDTNTSWTPTVPVTFDADGSAGDVVRARALVAGAWFVCALLESGDVACWGHDYGYLGTETNNFGAFRPSALVDFGGGLKALALGGSGGGHTCAILDDGSLKCWGNNGSGQLGLGDRTFHGRARGEMGSNLPAVDLGAGRRAVQVVGGGDHSCALLDDNSVKCWGSNVQDVPFQGWTLTGQLGLDANPIPTEALSPAGPVPLGAGRTVLGIGARNGQSCALLDGGDLKCWGSNRFGQLGLGDGAYRGDQPGEMTALNACIDLSP